MLTPSKRTLLLAMILPVAAFASGTSPDSQTEAKIRSLLESKGYTVESIEVEGAEFEAEVKLDGKELEVYLNSSLEITKVESD